MQPALGLNLCNPNNAENSRVFADLAHFAAVEDADSQTPKYNFLQDAGSAASDGDHTLVCKGKDVTARDDGCWALVFNSAANPPVINGPGFYDAERDLSVWTVRCPKKPFDPAKPEERTNGIGVRFGRPVDENSVHLYAPGVDYRNPPLLNPQFLAFLNKLKPAAPRRFILRTMDPQLVNQATVRTAGDIPKASDRWWGEPHGIPPELWARIEAESGCDVHGHIPACVDDAAMAAYVACIAATTGPFEAEPGNEVWNLFTKQWGAMRDHAKSLGFTSEHDDAGEYIRPFLATQYVLLDKLLRDAGCRGRVTICLSWQLGAPSWGEAMVAEIRKLDPALKCFDTIQGSPYYEVPFPADPSLQNNPDLAAADVIAAARRIPEFSSVGGNANDNLWDRVDYLAAFAKGIGKTWGVYEFGPELHGINPQWPPGSPEYRKLLATKTAVHDSPEMGDVTLAVCRKLAAKGARSMIYYKAPTAYSGFESLMGIAPSLAAWTPLCEALKTAAAETTIQATPPPPQDPPALPPAVQATLEAVADVKSKLKSADDAHARLDALKAQVAAAEAEAGRAAQAAEAAVRGLAARPGN